MASPSNVRYPLLFFKGKGTLTERWSHSWSLWSSSHSSSLVTKSLSPLFYHGSDMKHCKHRKQRKWCNSLESPCHQGRQPGCGIAQPPSPALVTDDSYSPWGPHLNGLLYAMVNCCVAASKCSWKKARASNKTCSDPYKDF